MPFTAIEKPWVAMAELVEANDADGLRLFLEQVGPADTARAISRLDEASRNRVFNLLPNEDAAELLEEIHEELAADLLEEISPAEAADILEELTGHERADILNEISPEAKEAILREMEPAEAEESRTLLSYPEDTAGGIMMTECLSYRAEQTVADVLADLRENRESYSDYFVQYAYIITTSGELCGVLRLRDVLLAKPDAPVSSLMLERPFRVTVDATLDELTQIFEDKEYIGLPVVDPTNNLVGVIRKSALWEAEEERSKDTYLKSSGIVGGEELRSMPLLSRISKRLAWLIPSLLLLLAASTVIVQNKDMIERHAILAAFLTIVGGLSGNTGNQAMAVSIRELAIGFIQPSEVAMVFFKELFLGLVVGIVLGAALGLAGFLFSGSMMLALVVGLALAANAVIAVCLGGVVPLVLKRFGLDPALASGPIVTTSVDMCGFFLVLTFAHLMLG